MTPTPNTQPVITGGILDRLQRTWETNRWDRDDLGTFRMMADDDSGDDDSDDGDDDKGDKGGDDDGETEARIAKANKEAADRRRELKPWKDLAKKHGLTAEQVDELVAKAKKAAPKDKADGEKNDDKPDLEALRREIESETKATSNRRIVRSEIKALAAELFADPADAPMYLDLDSYDVDDDGEVDEDAIREDLKALLKRKPHLAKSKDEPDPKNRNGRPKPDRAQGKRDVVKTGADAGKAEAERRFGKAKASTGTS